MNIERFLSQKTEKSKIMSEQNNPELDQEQSPKIYVIHDPNAFFKGLEESGIAQAVRNSVDEQCSGTEELTEQIKNLGVDLRCTCSTAPVQFEANLGNAYLYFRARWDHWACAIAPSISEAVRRENLYFFKEGEDQEASWMPHKDALEVIFECIKEYRAQTLDSSS